MNKTEMNIDEIEARLKVLEPKVQKWKWIVGIVASSVIMLAGGITLLFSSYYYLFIVLGVSLFAGGFAYLAINVRILSNVKGYQVEYDSLLKQKESLINDDKDKRIEISLKLFKEGKISEEEMKELIK